MRKIKCIGGGGGGGGGGQATTLVEVKKILAVVDSSHDHAGWNAY